MRVGIVTDATCDLPPEFIRAHDIGILPAALIEKEAFRVVFEGGSFAGLEAAGVSGVPAARRNVELFVDAVMDALAYPAPRAADLPAQRQAGLGQ